MPNRSQIVFGPDSFRIVHIGQGASVDLLHITLRNVLANFGGNGGAIANLNSASNNRIDNTTMADIRR